MLVLHQELGNHQHQDERGKHDGESCGRRAENAHPLRAAGIDDSGVAYVGGGVDADRTGRHLRYGHDVCELAHRHPMVVGDDLALNHGDHCITTAEAEEADEEEGIEELKVDHFNV